MTAEQLAARMKARAALIEPEFKKTTNGLAISALRFCKLKITEEIYALPVPTREQINAERRHATAIRSGRLAANTPFVFVGTAKRGSSGSQKAWKRTGNLRRSERAYARDAYNAVVINDAVYALPRHEMGKPGHRKARYPAHWRDELREVFRPIALDAYRLTVQAILKRGGL